MAETSIEWTDVTWNPVSGCTRASAGCDHCYAVTMTNRLEAMGQEKYSGLTAVNQRGNRHFNGVVRVHEDALPIPLGWKKPRKVFVNSMSDLFHKEVPFAFIDKVFAVMALCPQHTFQVLTKRPERMAEWFSSRRRNIGPVHSDVAWEMGDMYIDWDLPRHYIELAGPVDCGENWPLPNVWLGTSIENQQTANERIPHLLKVPAKVRFLSCEPLLGPVELSVNFEAGETLFQLGSHLHWVICGGESGPKARPMHPDWARSLRNQCQAAGIPFFFKQHGEFLSSYQCGERLTEIEPYRPNKGFSSYKFPDGTYVWKVGKKAAGRLLDGRIWDEMPEVYG